MESRYRPPASDLGVAPTARPVLVTTLAGFYFVAYCLVALQWLLYATAEELRPEMPALSAVVASGWIVWVEHALQIGLHLGFSVALFSLRKAALPLVAGAIAIAIASDAADWFTARELPSPWLAALLGVALYAWRLHARGVLR